MAQAGTFRDVKQLARKSLVYGVGSVLVRGVNFLLLPLYTRFLTPSDYGIVAVAVTITVILMILFPLGLQGAVTRFYFATTAESERRDELGTIWVGMVGAALAFSVVLLALGPWVFQLLVPDIPYSPYIVIAILTALVNVFGLLPLNLLQIQERPRAYVLMTAIGTLVTTGLVIVLVVVLRLGAYGYLAGMLGGGLVMVFPYLALTLRDVRMTLRRAILAGALRYGLPLVPHGLAAWLLELSDRAILGHFVSLGELGIYAIGYQFGSIMNLAAMAINNAWIPFVFKRVGDLEDAAKPGLARLATYFAAVVCWIGLGVCLAAKDALLLLTAPAFHPAAALVPWIVAGCALQGLYFIPGNFLMIRGHTRSIPLATLTAGVLNVGLNVWLAPRYGIIAGAWATFAGYAMMLVLIWLAARRVYAVAYEYRRLARILAASIGLFLLGQFLATDSIASDLAIRGLLWLAFPAALGLLGFYLPEEKARLRDAAGRAYSLARWPAGRP